MQSAVNKTGQKLSEEEMNAIFVIGDVDQNGKIIYYNILKIISEMILNRRD